MTVLSDHLELRRDDGRKLLVPYLMAGLPDREGFAAAVTTLSANADALEIGIPYSDPLMDGPVIAAAAERALSQGIRPPDAIALASELSVDIPRVAMTYYNPIHRLGEKEFCDSAAGAGLAGLIVPDLPLEESGSLRAEAAAAELAWVPLIAPTTPPERVRSIAATATGFVYAVSTMGVTGARAELSERAARVANACRAETDLPVLVGIGISTPEQARAAATEADGVVVGSALVAALLDQGIEAAAGLLNDMRAALDQG